MKTATRILSLLLLLAMITVLAACGTTETPATTPADDVPPTTQADDTPPDVPPAEEGLGAIEPDASLVYWSMWSEAEPQANVIAEAAQAFTAATGVPVNVNFNGRQLQREGLEPALSAGQEIDLFDEDIDRVSRTWAPYLLPLDDYVNEVYSDTNGQPYLSVLYKTLMDLAKDSGGGSYTVIPYQPFIFTTMYNKGLFEAAGITAPPTTWDAFLDACAKLKATGVTPITVDNAYIPCLFGYTLDRIVGSAKCAEMVANVDFSDPGVLKACQIWENMVSQGYISTKAATNVYPEGQAGEFAQETVAMYLNGTWLPNEIKALNPNIKWGSFAWPAIEATGDGPEAHNFGAQSFGINKNSKYPNAAFAFIRWMTLGTYDAKLAADSLGVPMAGDAVWPDATSEARSIFDGSTTRLTWAVGMEDNSDIGAAITDGFQKLVTGTYTAQQFADALAAV